MYSMCKMSRFYKIMLCCISLSCSREVKVTPETQEQPVNESIPQNVNDIITTMVESVKITEEDLYFIETLDKANMVRLIRVQTEMINSYIDALEE